MTDVPLLERAAQRRPPERQDAVNDELRRLLAAGLDLMRRNPGTIPRVSDVVAAAASSNDAFYRGFGSRDAFLAVIVDDGARRLLRYVERCMAAASGPQRRVEAALDALLRQAGDRSVADTTRAVLACAPARRSTEGISIGALAGRVGQVLAADLGALGSQDPYRDGLALARVAIGEMERHLRAGTEPADADRDYLHRLVGRLVA